MKGGKRANVAKSNYGFVLSSVEYPHTISFDIALTEFIKQFKEMKKQVRSKSQ